MERLEILKQAAKDTLIPVGDQDLAEYGIRGGLAALGASLGGGLAKNRVSGDLASAVTAVAMLLGAGAGDYAGKKVYESMTENGGRQALGTGPLGYPRGTGRALNQAMGKPGMGMGMSQGREGRMRVLKQLI